MFKPCMYIINIKLLGVMCPGADLVVGCRGCAYPLLVRAHLHPLNENLKKSCLVCISVFFFVWL